MARACGLRIGELLDLELDCVHEVPGNGAWLKVPLGKLDTERMVPLDDETVTLIDRIAAIRSDGRPLPHPRYGRTAQFLFTHHGRRLAQQALRVELNRAAATAGIGHVTPHQLRHTYATTMVNAGASLQALMALLGHISATMSLRYGRLFDTTVRAEYERALDLAKARIGPLTLDAFGSRSPGVVTGTMRRRSRHVSPVDTACALQPRDRVPMPTSASTAPTSAPRPPVARFSQLSGSMLRRSLSMLRHAAEQARQTAIGVSLPASTRS
ncbi:MAG: tyrosine-type recombinase/integrase [Actinobacteria bacterium]|nr:tyrosine-type recombinase/integrase [Actinomycetota bacterium]MCL5447501.1 tyrosine-type recombinase/integrase [Actinomycetota bacterium]